MGIIGIIGIFIGIYTHQEKQEDEIIWNEKQNVNKPILLEGMKAIKFEEGKENAVELSNQEMEEGIWYNYIAQEGQTQQGGTSKWTNAKTLDGSMWVWIPRYAYKIEWNPEQEIAGKIDIMFLKGDTNDNKEGEYNKAKYSGIFDFMNHSGHSFGSYSFRCVLIKQ